MSIFVVCVNLWYGGQPLHHLYLFITISTNQPQSKRSTTIAAHHPQVTAENPHESRLYREQYEAAKDLFVTGDMDKCVEAAKYNLT
jgi:hypothetical protein